MIQGLITKKDKPSKDLCSLINNLDNYLALEILELYMKRCLKFYAFAFCQWRAKHDLGSEKQLKEVFKTLQEDLLEKVSTCATEKYHTIGDKEDASSLDEET
jgi:hypothetical protein